MTKPDFLTSVENAFLNIFNANAILSGYHWQPWDSDAQLELPRGVLGLRARRDPEETPYHRIDVTLRLEGRPQKQELSTVMNEVMTVLKTTSPEELTQASNNLAQFIGRANVAIEDRPIQSGLRTWQLQFVVYAVPME